MERRGAAEVLAIDLGFLESDVPYHLPGGKEYRKPGENFGVLASLLKSKATFRRMSIHELSPAAVGTFDVVFVGYMLHQLRDPVGALETVRKVTRGSVIVLDEILYFHSLLSGQPLARFGHRKAFSEWWYFNAEGLKRVVEFAGFEVGAVSPYLFYRKGPGVRASEVPLWTRFRYAFLRAACSLAVRGDAL